MIKLQLPPNLRTLILVDGSYRPDTIKGALESLTVDEQYLISGLVYLGEGDLIPQPGEEPWGNLTLYPQEGESLIEVLERGLTTFNPQIVVDLTSRPKIDWRSRMMLASRALFLGFPFVGSDFALYPPQLEQISQKPSLSIIALGKRAGKTALTAHTARLLKEEGINPVVITMSRGGPSFPEIFFGAEEMLTPHMLLQIAESGRHACADYLETALFSQVTTIGCRRAGEGICGVPFKSIVVDGALQANDLPADIFIFEGSGISIPPIKCDRTILILPATLPLRELEDICGLYHLWSADMVFITHLQSARPKNLRTLINFIRELLGEIHIMKLELEPHPLGDIKSKPIFLASTAPQEVLSSHKKLLKEKYKCKIVATSSHLSHQEALIKDIEEALGLPHPPQVLLTELKAHAVDTATRIFLEADREVVYLDNRPRQAAKVDRLPKTLLEIAKQAIDSFSGR